MCFVLSQKGPGYSHDIVLYINPQGASTIVLEQLKTELLAQPGTQDMFGMEETILSCRDLLAKTRQEAKLQGEPCPFFWLLDKHSAAKGAVQCIQTYQSICVKGMSIRWPSAAATRTFYAAPERTALTSAYITYGYTDFDEIVATWTDSCNKLVW